MTVVGPEPHRDLTDEERACLLRAARVRLAQLNEELTTLLALRGPEKLVKSARDEILCVSSAIRWLWRDGARPGDGMPL